MKTFGRTLLLAVLVVLLYPGTASAHVRSTEGTAVIRQDGSTVRFDMNLEYDLLTAATGLGFPPGTDDQKTRLLTDHHEAVEKYLTDRVDVSIDGVVCESVLTRTGVLRLQDRPYARAVLTFTCPGASDGSYRVRYDVFGERDAIVDEHTSIVDYQLGGRSGTYVFDGAHHEFEAGRTGILSAVGRFVAMGVEHILSGLDHVLFLAVLLIGARKLGSVVKVATTFTVAHSVTLVLGVLGWVSVPSQIVEPLIALSIAYVAVENIIGGESRRRLLVVFCFGLLHGLGFASTLSFTDELSPRLIGSLVSFNVGIELGQALIIAVIFPILMLIRRSSWSAVVHMVATLAAAGLGFVWFFQRLLI